MEKPLYKCLTKATTAKGDQLKCGPSWAIAKRGFLKVFADRLECGKWIIPNASIKEAILYSIRSNLFIPGYILKVVTDEKVFHFGLNWGGFWKGDLPFEVRREKSGLGYSISSLISRFVFLVCIFYFLWERFIK